MVGRNLVVREIVVNWVFCRIIARKSSYLFSLMIGCLGNSEWVLQG